MTKTSDTHCAEGRTTAGGTAVVLWLLQSPQQRSYVYRPARSSTTSFRSAGGSLLDQAA